MGIGIGSDIYMNKRRFRDLYMKIQKSQVFIVTVLLKDIVDEVTWKKVKEEFIEYFDLDTLSIEFLAIIIDKEYVKVDILYHIKNYGNWYSGCSFTSNDFDEVKEQLPAMLEQVIDYELEPMKLLQEVAEFLTCKILEE